jgi:Secretion system C-terminal sorting domain
MKNVLFILLFSLVASSSFGQGPPFCTATQPNSFTQCINDASGNDASAIVIIPESNSTGVSVTYFKDNVAISALGIPVCSNSKRPWDGCDGTGNQLSSSAQSITAIWKRQSPPYDCGPYTGWVGIDLFSRCLPQGIRATLNITVFQECADVQCLIGNCVHITNNHAQTRCYQLTVGGQTIIITVPPFTKVVTCVPGLTSVTFPLPIVSCSGCTNCSLVNGSSSSTLNGKSSNSKGIIYPSPASEVINIQFPIEYKGETDVMVFDIAGKVVFKEKFDAEFETKISTNNWLSGLYLVQLTNKQSQMTQKIMVQH